MPKEAETYITKRGRSIGKNKRRRSDTFITTSKETGREVVLNDCFADHILNDKGYKIVPKVMNFGMGLDFDEDGNII